MARTVLFIVYFTFIAGMGIILGCFIHAQRVNQTTVMSGVALVREMPYGEWIVGNIETVVFSYQEKKDLQKFQEKFKGQIHIDPEVLKRHKELYGDQSESNK